MSNDNKAFSLLRTDIYEIQKASTKSTCNIKITQKILHVLYNELEWTAEFNSLE